MDDLTSDAGARKFLEHVEDCARTALLPINKLTDEDRQTLEVGLKRLRPAFEQLATVIRETAKPGYGPVGWGALWAVMGWSFAIGCKSDVLASAEPYLQSLRARGNRVVRANPINDGILEILIQRGRDTHSSEIEKELIKQGLKKNEPASKGDAAREKAAFAKRVSVVRKRLP
jgi:hypothetical protein